MTERYRTILMDESLLASRKFWMMLLFFWFTTAVIAQKQDPVIYSRTILWEMYPNLTMKDDLVDRTAECVFRKEGKIFTGYSYEQTNTKTFEIERYENGKFTGHRFGFEDGRDTLTYRLTFEEWPTDTNRQMINKKTYFPSGNLKENSFHQLIECEHLHHEVTTIHGGYTDALLPHDTYYENGQLRVSSTGNVRSNGSIQFYSPEGDLWSSRTYKDGKPYGLWERYEKDGSCSGKLRFKDGKPRRGFWSFEDGVKIKARKLRKQGTKIL